MFTPNEFTCYIYDTPRVRVVLQTNYISDICGEGRIIKGIVIL